MNLFFLQPGTNRFDGGGSVDGLRYNQNNVTIEGVGNRTPCSRAAPPSLSPRSPSRPSVSTASSPPAPPPSSAAAPAPRSRSSTTPAPTSSTAPASTSTATRPSTRLPSSPTSRDWKKRPSSATSSAAPSAAPSSRTALFFHFTYEGIRAEDRDIGNATVYTNHFKNTGDFRYAIGGKNSVDLVDANGNPLIPADDIGDINVAAVDPTRLGKDSTGLFDSLGGSFPAPNNFDIGDGFNTGGYRFLVEHPYTETQRVLKETCHQFPAPPGRDLRRPPLLQPGADSCSTATRGSVNEKYLPAGILTLNSSFSPTLLNEFRAGGTSRTSDFINPDPDRFNPRASPSLPAWGLKAGIIPSPSSCPRPSPPPASPSPTTSPGSGATTASAAASTSGFIEPTSGSAATATSRSSTPTSGSNPATIPACPVWTPRQPGPSSSPTTTPAASAASARISSPTPPTPSPPSRPSSDAGGPRSTASSSRTPGRFGPT